MKLKSIASLVLLAAIAGTNMKQPTVKAAGMDSIIREDQINRLADQAPGVGLRIGQHTMDKFIANMDGFFP